MALLAILLPLMVSLATFQTLLAVMEKLSSTLASEHFATGFTAMVIFLITLLNKCPHQRYKRGCYLLLVKVNWTYYLVIPIVSEIRLS